MRHLSTKANAGDLEFLIKLVEEVKVKPVMRQGLFTEETPAAVKYLGQGHASGKVIINVV